MEIIIFFVVISIISNIIKAVSRQKPVQLGGTRETTSPNLHEIQLPENRVERVNPKYEVKVQNPTPKVTNPSQVKPQKRNIPQAEIQSQTIPQANPQPKIGLTNLTPNKLVEGIILSEILAPPKSRR